MKKMMCLSGAEWYLDLHVLPGTDTEKLTPLRSSRRANSSPYVRTNVAALSYSSLFLRRFEAVAASGLIRAFSADDDAFVRIGRTLRAVSRIAADHAYGKRLRDVFGNGHQCGHRFERLSPVILVEARNNDAFAAVGKLFADVDKVGAEELSLIDANDLRVGRKEKYLFRIFDHGGNE